MNEQAIHPEISNAHQELEYIAEFLGRSNARAFVEYNPILVTHKNIFVVTSSHVAKKRIAYPVVFAQNSFVSIEKANTPISSLDETEIYSLCIEELGKFASYAKKILERKGIELSKITTRRWQAIEDDSWKQCILELTLHSDSQTALCIWDELSEELDRFINIESEDLQPLLRQRLTLDVSWS